MIDKDFDLKQLTKAEREKFLKAFCHREREMLKLKFGLGDGYAYSVKEISQIFKCRQSKVEFVIQKAARKLSENQIPRS